MTKLLHHVVFLYLYLWTHGTAGQGDTTSVTSTSTSTVQVTTTTTALGTAGLSSSKAGNATCPSRTVNYITHTLPRQCLRTDRVPQNATGVANGTDASVTGPEHASSSSSAESTDRKAPETTAVEHESTVHNTTFGADDTTIKETTQAASTATPSTEEANPSATSEDEADSPLDNANFLSFEEWKKQNLAKLGQSLDDVGRAQAADPNRPRPVISNALDSLGEEAEIDLDFSGFGGAAKPHVSESPSVYSAASVAEREPGSPLARSKDAGKTCKERTNYASFDCSATILKSNKECKSASSVLVENKDSYMLNVCSASNKFFIVELCTDIQIDTIVLANYEFFSSSFRHFRVSVSDRYPVKMEKWRDLGTFEARNTREIQAFLVENPLIWAKYLRVEFLTQYGTEYYCPVSLLRVHGTTMIEDFRHQAGFAAGDDEETTLEAEALATPPVHQEPAESTDESSKATIQSMPKVEENPAATVPEGPPAETTSAPTAEATSETGHKQINSSGGILEDVAEAMKAIGVYEPLNLNLTCDDSLTTSSPSPENSPSTPSDQIQVAPSTAPTDSTQSGVGSQSTSTSIASDSSATSLEAPSSSIASDTEASPSTPVSSQNETVAGPPVSAIPSSNTTSIEAGTIPSSETASIPQTTQPSVAASSNSTTATVASTQPSQSNAVTNSTRTAPSSSTGAQAPQPSTQESFFKSFHKRLLQLESNSTLSLQYIEEQSRILRDAFSKVEKRQVGSTTKFLSQLNETVMAELHGFRQAYDQLWQSTVIELEGQRETYQREMLALSARLTMVADELVWQKRMGIVQSTLLLLCLALVLFGRSANGYLEVPLMQQMMNKSTAALRAGWESPPNSPSPDSRSPVSLFRRKLWRSSTEPAGDTGNLTDTDVSRPQSKEGPSVLVEPPSPTSQAVPDEVEDDEYHDDSSPNVERKDPGASQGPVSPKRRKKPKKPPNWPKENGRIKSPLAM